MNHHNNLNIGNTPVKKAIELSRHLGCGPIYLKLEKSNPTRSHKDRMALKSYQRAKLLGKKGICTGSCGSYGLSVAYLCHLTGLKSKIFIPKGYTNDKIRKIALYTNDLSFVSGTYEDAIEESNKFCQKNDYYNANPIGPNLKYCQSSYIPLAEEILTQTDNNLHRIWLPLGNGTTFAGLFSGFKKHGYFPPFGLVGSLGNSAIIASLKSGRSITLHPDSIAESEKNEPLISWLPPPDIDDLIAISKKINIENVEVSDEQLSAAADLLKKFEGLDITPYSSAGLAGLVDRQFHLGNTESHLILLTS